VLQIDARDSTEDLNEIDTIERFIKFANSKLAGQPADHAETSVSPCRRLIIEANQDSGERRESHPEGRPKAARGSRSSSRQNSEDIFAGHLSAILREIRLRYANSDGEMPLAFLNLANQPMSLSWDSILALGTHNQFIDTTVMDWI
jgi:hypothetical protein